MRKLLLLKILFLLGIWLMACNASPKPQEFKSEGGRFSVMAPVAMKETVQVLDTAAGKIDLHQFLAQQGDISYFVSYSDYAQELIQKSDPEKVLDGCRNGAVSNANGKLSNETKIRIEGNTGRELVIEGKTENGEEAMAKGRIFLVKNRLYQVMVAVPKGRGNLGVMNDFLGSFKLTASTSIPPQTQNAQNIFYYSPGKFSFNLPLGWKMVPKDVVEEYSGKLESYYKIKVPRYDLCFNRVDANWPFETPYFFITIYKGYKSKDYIDKFKSSIQQETKKAFKDFAIKELFAGTFIHQPIHDKQKNMLVFSVDSNIKSPDGKYISQKQVISSIFCKYGIINIIFCVNSDMISSYFPIIKNILDSFTFDEGYEYR